MTETSKLLKKGFKFPIYPTAEQRQQLEKVFGCCRYVYNRALAQSKAEYQLYMELRDNGHFETLHEILGEIEKFENVLIALIFSLL